MVLDDTVRFVGQRVAAVVADTVAIAENACRAIDVDYEELPAVFDPEAARSPGAPLLHGDKGADARIADASPQPRRRAARRRRRRRRGLGAAEGRRRRGGAAGAGPRNASSTRTWRRTAARAGAMSDGRLVMRTSSQVPFLVRDELCHVFGLDRDEVRVFTRRVGGGFGGKQEMLTEDLVALAVLRLGRPVRYEFSRSDQFTRRRAGTRSGSTPRSRRAPTGC